MKLAWVVVLLSALVLRFLLFFVISLNDPARFIQSDSIAYLKIAENIINKGIVSSSDSPPYAPEHTRTPGYPVFLSVFKAFGLGTRAIITGQIMISFATLILTMSFCCYFLKLSKLSTLLSGLIIAADLPSIILANSILTETLFTFLLFSGTVCLLYYLNNASGWYLLLSALLLGLCCLCRPSAFLLPAFIIIGIVIVGAASKRNVILTSAVLSLVYIASVSPWLVRNKLIFGGIFVSTISYDNLLYVQAVGVRSVVGRISYDEAKAGVSREFASRYESQIKTGSMLSIKKLEGQMAVEIIASHPFTYVSNYFRSIFNMLTKPIRNDIDLMLGFTDRHTTMDIWGSDSRQGLVSRFLSSTSMFAVFACVFQLVMLFGIYIFASIGLSNGFHLFKPAVTIMAIVIVYFCLMSGAPEVYARFRVPLMPFFAVLSAAGVEAIFKRANNEETT